MSVIFPITVSHFQLPSLLCLKPLFLWKLAGHSYVVVLNDSRSLPWGHLSEMFSYRQLAFIFTSPNPVILKPSVNVWYPAYQTSALQFIKVVKLQLWGSNKNNYMVGAVTTIFKVCDFRQVESHCSSPSFICLQTVYGLMSLKPTPFLRTESCIQGSVYKVGIAIWYIQYAFYTLLSIRTWESTLISFSFPPYASIKDQHAITDFISNFSRVSSIPSMLLLL